MVFKEDDRDHSGELMSIFNLHHDKMRKALDDIVNVQGDNSKGNDEQIKYINSKIKELHK